jgi:hypothetical protein
VKPTYEVRAWRERGWWLARVVGASDGADETPLNALAHARTLTTIEETTRDLVAMILDADEHTFDIDLEYVLPADVETVVCEAIGARTWLDAAQHLWREQSALAVRALSDHGFSLQETAQLLGLSDRRVGQMLAREADPGQYAA